MKVLWDAGALPEGGVLITCSSHEDRCRAIPEGRAEWRPEIVALFHYDDPNPRRERNHGRLLEHYVSQRLIELPFREKAPAESFWSLRATLRELLSAARGRVVVLDISVFTKRHLLLILQWLNDSDVKPIMVYAEPEDYDVSEHIPLSFGLSSIEEIPGFTAVADTSRPLQVVLLLGFEGERALATYDLLQPVETLLVVPSRPINERWIGRSEHFNRDLISVVGERHTGYVDPIDPDETVRFLRSRLGEEGERSAFARVICPLGTKPQAVGAFDYARRCVDPPAIIYTSPLRHNHDFSSHGIGRLWLLTVSE